jgi:hypothetical protein
MRYSPRQNKIIFTMDEAEVISNATPESEGQVCTEDEINYKDGTAYHGEV